MAQLFIYLTLFKFLNLNIVIDINCFSKIQNGKKKLYALKDRKLLCRTKGAIELEMTFVFNQVRFVYLSIEK